MNKFMLASRIMKTLALLSVIGGIILMIQIINLGAYITTDLSVQIYPLIAGIISGLFFLALGFIADGQYEQAERFEQLLANQQPKNELSTPAKPVSKQLPADAWDCQCGSRVRMVTTCPSCGASKPV
jgi:uncharacterized membrane protein